jgi:hypothetical protein
MNKLILISLVIFFTICSKSWAETIKGLCGKYKGEIWLSEKSQKLNIKQFLEGISYIK